MEKAPLSKGCKGGGVTRGASPELQLVRNRSPTVGNIQNPVGIFMTSFLPGNRNTLEDGRMADFAAHLNPEKPETFPRFFQRTA
jgi:hypothetical protein